MPEAGRTRMSESTDDKSTPTRTFWPPSDWSLRRKVVAALALPLIFAAALVGVRVAGAWSDSQAASNAKARYAALEPAIGYLAASQDLATENVRTPADATAQTAARAAQLKAKATLQSAIGKSGLTANERSLLSSAIGAGNDLASTGATTPVAMSLSTGTISSDVLGFIDDLAGIRPDTTLNALHDLVTAQTHLSDQRIELFSAPDFGSALRSQFSADIGGERDALERVQAAHLPGVDVSGPQSATTSRLAYITNGTQDDLRGGTLSVQASYRAPYTAATKDAISRVSQQANDSRRTALEQIALLIALLAITVLLALLISRNLLVRPITRLRRSTLDVANEELPAAIERVQTGQGVGRIKSVALTNREEIGQLSRAIDGMQNRAIRLAGEQATLRRQMTDMFETLSRRSTSLVNQQLNLLEQLERSEDDSARLDSLFRLDHMAARMRRNGQSLMVLAGNEGHRAAGQPLAIGQVIGAAISEVQDYQRVGVGQLPDRVIDAQVATDLVHIVAELLDNALAYSPPDSKVTISGARVIDGGLLVEIEDHGLGIDTDELTRLNADLAAGGRFGVETTRRMGLFVVGRLGRTHDIQIRLRSKPNQGTVVGVQVPVDVLADESSLEPVSHQTARSTEDERRQAMPTPPPAPIPAAALTPATPAFVPATPDDTIGSNPPGPALTGGGLPRRQPGASGAAAQLDTRASAPTEPLPRRVPRQATAATAQSDASSTVDAARLVEPASHAGTSVTPDPERARGASAFFSGSRGARPAESDPPLREEPARRHTPPPPPEETPIFQEISSRWLDAGVQPLLPWTDDRTDQAWAAAREATDDHTPADQGGALPRRRPGLYVVPGRVEPQSRGAGQQPGTGGRAPADGRRDPEVVRSKLSRYKAGVERARREAAGNESGDQDQQDNGSRQW